MDQVTTIYAKTNTSFDHVTNERVSSINLTRIQTCKRATTNQIEGDSENTEITTQMARTDNINSKEQTQKWKIHTQQLPRNRETATGSKRESRKQRRKKKNKAQSRSLEAMRVEEERVRDSTRVFLQSQKMGFRRNLTKREKKKT